MITIAINALRYRTKQEEQDATEMSKMRCTERGSRTYKMAQQRALSVFSLLVYTAWFVKEGGRGGWSGSDGVGDVNLEQAQTRRVSCGAR